jgi:hypothetical protein
MPARDDGIRNALRGNDKREYWIAVIANGVKQSRKIILDRHAALAMTG